MLKWPFIIAGRLFEWASEQGFIGVAVYIAYWVFMFPVMLGICIVGGFIGWIANKDEERFLSPNMPRDEAERLQWREEDRRYAERLAARKEKKKRTETSEPN